MKVVITNEKRTLLVKKTEASFMRNINDEKMAEYKRL